MGLAPLPPRLGPRFPIIQDISVNKLASRADPLTSRTYHRGAPPAANTGARARAPVHKQNGPPRLTHLASL